MNRELKSAIVDDIMAGALSHARSLPLGLPAVRAVSEISEAGSFTVHLDDGTAARFYVTIREAIR